MTAIEQSVEIARSPEDVFAYLDKLDRHGEWQEGLVVEQVQGDGGVGTRVRERRTMGGREQFDEWEVTAHDPPRSYAFRGLTGPLRPIGGGRLESIDGGSATRYTMTLDFEPHGIGYLLRPLARAQARKATASAQSKLKDVLESHRDT